MIKFRIHNNKSLSGFFLVVGLVFLSFPVRAQYQTPPRCSKIIGLVTFVRDQLRLDLGPTGVKLGMAPRFHSVVFFDSRALPNLRQGIHRNLPVARPRISGNYVPEKRFSHLSKAEQKRVKRQRRLAKTRKRPRRRHLLEADRSHHDGRRHSGR